jgi:hypothetical protein
MQAGTHFVLIRDNFPVLFRGKVQVLQIPEKFQQASGK